MRQRVTLVIAVVAALGAALSASAIVGGRPDATHTYVGGVIQQQTQNGVTGFERCTGFLIGPTHFVSAAHCFDPNGGPILVTFDQTLSPTTSHFVAATITRTFDDVAVLTLGQPQPGPYAMLPPVPNISETLSVVDVVGYGVEGLTPKKVPTGFGTRSIVTTSVKSAGSQSGESLKLLADPGACFGDSGGPNLVSGTNTVVAITTSGSKNCNGVSYAERIDTAGALAILTAFASS
jgi:hypothetical protein